MMRWIVLGLLLLAPAANGLSLAVDDGAPVRMHFHLTGFQDFVINTQPLEADNTYTETVSAGLAMSSTCARDPTGAQTLSNQGHQTWYGTGRHSLVVYEFDEDGRPFIGMAPGTMRDIHLDTNQPTTLDWYIVPGNREASLPSPIPMQLTATIRASDDVSVGQEAYNNGELIARGQSAAVALHPDVDHPQVSHRVVDGKDVYGFHIPLDLHTDTIRAQDGYNVRIDLYSDLPCNEDHGWSPVQHMAFTGPEARPGMDWSVHDAIHIDALQPQMLGNDLVVHSLSSSPFGPFDVAPPSVHVAEAVAQPQVVLQEVEPCRSHACADQDQMVGTWVWDLAKERPGLYHVTMNVSNVQGTASTTKTFQFEIGDGTYTMCSEGDGVRSCKTLHTADRDAPGPAPLLLVGLMAFFVARRR